MIRVAAVAGIALGIAGVAAWFALPARHVHAAPPEPAPTAIVDVPLRPLVDAFPDYPDGASGNEAPCPQSRGHVPIVRLVSYAAIEGMPAPLEQEVFAETASVPAPAPASIHAGDGRVAVLRTLADDEQSGRYEGRVVVFDGSKQALCQTRVVVSSRGDLRWADVSPHALHRAHVEAVRRAVQEAGARLAVELRLPN